MKCKMDRRFGVYDAGTDRAIGLKPLMFGFQDVVAEHSKEAGRGIDWLLGQKKAWVMHRMHIRIHQMPVMGEDLNFVTWHKGEKGFKAFRDYEVWCGVRKRISAASSWLFIDLARSKILRVPEESRDWYTVETKNALDEDIDYFRPVPKTPCRAVETMAVRSSDMDPIGHVNNAVYLDYLETAVDRRFAKEWKTGQKIGRKIKEVWIQFHKEISPRTPSVEVGIGEEKDQLQFTIMSEAGIHAFGEFTTKVA